MDWDEHTASRIWYSSFEHSNGLIEEFNENCSFPIWDLSNKSPCLTEDTFYTYCMTDIDKISQDLSIPWETSKDQPFTDSATYISFMWNLEQRTVMLSPAKTQKYIIVKNVRALLYIQTYPQYYLDGRYSRRD